MIHRALTRLSRWFRPEDESIPPIPLAAVLTTALILAVPVGALALRQVLPSPFPLLLCLGVVGAGYGLYIWFAGELLVGSAVAVVVLSTFNANFPIPGVESGYPGNVVGELVLVQVPLILLCGLVLKGGVSRASLSRPVLALGGFVVWSVLAAFFGAGPNTVVAMFFSVYAAFGFATLLAFQWLILEDHISFRTLVSVVAVTVAGQLAVAVAQFLNQGSFGLTMLGEGGDITVSVSQLPLVGEVAFGTFVSGFTGMSFNLANLAVLALPALFALVYRLTDFRWYLVVAFLFPFGLVRATSTDAGRGALLFAVFAFAALAGWGYLGRTRLSFQSVLSSQQAGLGSGWIGSAVIGLLLLFYPSSASGQSSRIQNVTSDTDAQGTSPNADTINTTQASEANGANDHGLSEQLLEKLTTSSIPFFDLSNIGIRLRQYLVGVEIFFQYPLFGLGGMNFVLVAESYGISPRPGEELPLPIHNIYIALLAETGLIGFLLYVGALLLVVLSGFRLLRSSETDYLLVAGVMAGFIGSLAFGFWDHLQLYSVTGFLPLWILAGALVGESRRVAHRSSAFSTT